MNRLANETSPYLLQHAHNPVDWYAWGDEALQKACDEDKPILVSIGYSACHWCHVMERESFENETIARRMNELFVCIKVDREERPDVDAIYMEAVQAMGVQGGWPLNVFLMPDAKPFYGLTYAPAQNWYNLLGGVREAFDTNREQLRQSAEGFAEHLNTSELARFNLTEGDPIFALETVETMYRKLATRFDTEDGGTGRAPKFPMPALYGFLLRYADLTGDASAYNQLTLTLNRMALGGIYDQIGGGFARYSTDRHWFAPHFEKMLYDNAQLLTLYSEAYTLTGNALYRDTVYGTIRFMERELLSPEGGFYSALDADSEGVEGKFYTWSAEELQTMLGDDFEWFEKLYTITDEGNWEEGRTNILHRTETNPAFADQMGWTAEKLETKLAYTHQKLMAERDKRIRPGLDDKMLCSWNGLALKGLVTAYRVFNEPDFLQTALRLAFFIRQKLTDSRNGGRLWHSYKMAPNSMPGRAKQLGFLEDYAAVIDGYLALYQATFNEDWLTEADRLAQYVFNQFDDVKTENSDAPHDPLFFFTDKSGEELIARKKEVFDNVIPASNSMMAHNLYTLSLLLDRPQYAKRVDQLLGQMQSLLEGEANYLTNWAALYAIRVRPTAEIALVGPDVQAFRREIDARFFPNKVLAGTEGKSGLPLLNLRTPIDGRTALYVCYNRACRLPVTSVDAMWEQVG
ncbi:thioredoxin domain-containing protein [Fibrella sp. HMF5335]|uniref:Thioredoxin domain-containing protein n=1 Tax=Fibrella rubiginis TaxID=2817060 RepID=A0A939GII8_9BACT|nr:thioredoxin domain-containing protein [Fibrella rubiginis]MBO0939709.1 thioredoxin domain-containing protein [Fibrella rubiginis]